VAADGAASVALLLVEVPGSGVDLAAVLDGLRAPIAAKLSIDVPAPAR
jgi:hypothetical protein